MTEDVYSIYKSVQKQNMFFFKTIKQKDNSFYAGIKCSKCLTTLNREHFLRTNYEENNQIKGRLLITLIKYNSDGKCPKCGTVIIPKRGGQ